MKEFVVGNIVSHFLVQRRAGEQYQLPLCSVVRLYGQRQRCILYMLLGFIGALVALTLQILLVRYDWGTSATETTLRWLLIADMLAMMFFVFRYVYKTVMIGNITDRNSTAGDFLEAVRAFEWEFGNAPHKLGPIGAEKAMVTTARKILRLEKRHKDPGSLRRKLNRQFDTAKALMPVPASGLGPIFDKASGGGK